MIGFCAVMLASVVAFFCVFPNSLSRLLPYAQTSAVSEGQSVVTGYYKYPYSWDLTVANRHFFIGTLGFYLDFNIPTIIEFLGFCALASVILGLIAFLFRNESWLKKCIAKVKALIHKACGFVAQACKRFDSSAVVVLLAVICNLLIIPYSATLYSMGFCDRYFFPAMALFLILAISFMGVMLGLLMRSAGKIGIRLVISVTAGFVFCIMCFRTYIFTQSFVFNWMAVEEIADNLAEKNCYVYLTKSRDMIWISPVLSDSEDVYIDTITLIGSDDHTFPELSSGTMLLIVNDGFLTEEQKEAYLNGDAYDVEELNKPDVMYTSDDFVKEIELNCGLESRFIGEYETFIGDLLVYEME
jgi:hypothetical protein